jgi:putative transposase
MAAFFRRVKQGDKPGFPQRKRPEDSNQGFMVPEHCRLDGRYLIATGMRLKLARTIPLAGTVGKAVRIKRVAGRWYASFTVEVDIPEVAPIAPENLVGIDIGFRKYITISDGTVITNPRWTKQYARKLAHLQRRAARQKKGSNRRKKTITRIAKVHAGIANRRKHYSHLISKQVAENYDAVCIESHSLKAQQQSRFAKSLTDVGHGHFRRCLEYKLPDRGKQLLAADPYFPSSKLCHVCGFKNTTLGFEEKWTCPSCRTAHDRDFNASKNLEHEGRQQVAADQMQTT